MANVQTDQGWYADEYWVKQSAGALGKVGSSAPPTPTPSAMTMLPKVGTLSASSILAAGYLVASDQGGSIYCAVNNADATVFLTYFPQGNPYRTRQCVCSKTPQAQYGWASTTGGSDITTTGSGAASTAYGDIYTHVSNWNIVSSQIIGNVPFYETLADGYEAAAALLYGGGQQSTISKANTGYAVACWAKYLYDNEEFVRPILISANQGPAHIQKDEQGGSEVESVYTKTWQSKGLYVAITNDSFDANQLEATGAILSDFTSVPLSSDTPANIVDALFPLIIQRSNFHWGDEDNPYSEGGETGPGGGGGDYSNPSDPISIPTTPTYGYANAGFFSIWIPDDDQINTLSTFMWNADPLVIDFWKRMVADPIDLVIGLSVVPFYIAPTGSSAVSMGFVNTGVTLNYTDKQYFEVDCGSVTIEEHWGAYLDYNPYTKIEIFLPYIGSRHLDADECMGKTLNVVYKIDIVSGSCVALIKVDNSVLYHFEGNCAVSVPVTSFQMQGLMTKIVNTGLAGAAVMAGIGGPLAAGAFASSAANLMSTKTTVPKASNISSAAGLLDVQKPYLVITRPKQAIPAEQNVYTGYPSFITSTLGSLSGYTEVEAIHLDNIPCTAAELNEIDTLLRNGVIF